MERQEPLKPLDMGQRLDRALNIYFGNLRSLIATAALILAPVAAIQIALVLNALSATPGANDLGKIEWGDHIKIVDLTTFNTAVYIGAALSVVASFLVIGACFRAVNDAYVGGRPDAMRSARTAFDKLPSMVWIGFLATVLVTIASFAFLLPGIWLGIALSLCFPALLAEGYKGRKALRRSFDLVKDHWWSTFGTLIVGGLVIVFALIAGSALIDAVTVSLSSAQAFEVVDRAANAALLTLTTPFQAALIAVVYFDLRIRKESLELGHLTGELARENPVPGDARGDGPEQG